MKTGIEHSILTVSASGEFDGIVKRALKPGTFMSVEFQKSGSNARRHILERFVDIVVINAPLPDEPGSELALDITEKCSASVLLVVPKDSYQETLEKVNDRGILLVAKPFPRGRIDRALSFLTAFQDRLRGLEKELQSTREKLDEIRIISKAKLLLIEKKHLSEDEAHRFIGKAAMKDGISRARAAERIMEDLLD